jgi:hypothetical protein
VVTNVATGSAEHIYDTLCCATGQGEILIKMHKRQLGSGRTSCCSPLANQMRLIQHDDDARCHSQRALTRQGRVRNHAPAAATSVARVIETVSRVCLASRQLVPTPE